MAMLDYCGNSIKSFRDIAKQPGCGTGINSIQQILDGPSCGTQLEDLDDVVGILGYHEPNGKHICQLDDASPLQKNDCFLLTKEDENALLSSNKCMYSTFESRVFRDVIDGLSVGTMAWKDKNEYSLTSHHHDDLYSRVVCKINPRYQNDGLTIGVLSSTTNNTTVVTTIKVPKIEVPVPPQPMIGTFKFVSAKSWAKLSMSNATQINPYDSSQKIRDDFDGWVWANGSTIKNTSSQLSAAASLFGSGPNASEFVVPDFSQFFKANPKTVEGYSSQNAYIEFPKQVGMPAHSHNVTSIMLFGQVKLDSSVNPIGTNSSINDDVNRQNKGVHHGSLKSKEVTVDVTINTSNMTFPAISTNGISSGVSQSDQPCPRHNVIPVMIYIGGVTRKYFEK